VLASATIDCVPGDFPPVWKPSGYVKGMVEIDDAFENLKAIENAGWTTPADHPDLVPVAEAGRLADVMRLLIDSDYVARKPADLAARMREGNKRAQALEELLSSGKTDLPRLSDQFKLVSLSCKGCHTKYRD